MVIGDSLADGLAGGLRRLDREHGRYLVRNEARVASGLLPLGTFDWADEIRRLLGRERPGALVVLLGLNDCRAIPPAGWIDAVARRVRQRAAALMDAARSSGVQVVWTGLPILRDPDLSRSAMQLNRLCREAVAENPGPAAFVDLWELSGAGGAYTAYVPNESGVMTRFREPDGIHFTAFGYEIVARHILEGLRPL